MPYSQRKSVILLGFLEFLERFSYYGVRSLIILFSIDILELESEATFSIFSKFMILGFILPLPAGIISDAFFKQKKGILYGGLIALFGYLMLITEEMLPVGIGLILVLIGTGLIKPNLTVLVGRLFEKTDKNRGFAFLYYHFLINLGAFFSILIVGYISNRYGFKYGFMITAFISLKFLILFNLIKDQLPLIEKNINKKYVEFNKMNDIILDAELTQNQRPNPKSHFLIGLIILITILFWHIFEMNGIRIQEYVLQNPDISIGTIDIKNYYLQSAYGLISLLVFIVLILVWNARGLGSTTLKFIFAMILIGISGLIVANISSFPFNGLVPVLGLTITIYSLAELLISPFAYSYITRLSDTRYSSTIVGGFICLIGVGSHLLSFFSKNIYPSNWISIVSVFSILIGFALFFFRKKLLKMSGGLD